MLGVVCIVVHGVVNVGSALIVSAGEKYTLNKLLRAGSDANQADYTGLVPLHIAAMRGDVPMVGCVCLLLDRKEASMHGFACKRTPSYTLSCTVPHSFFYFIVIKSCWMLMRAAVIVCCSC
jgi:ankyrin repeat protein